MDIRISKIRKTLLFILAAAVLAMAAFIMSAETCNAAGEDDEKAEDRPDITIEVVEDIPAADIEEPDVPLADSADTAAAGSTRHTVIMWTFAAAVIAYAIFLISGMNLRKNRRKMKDGTEGDRGDSTGGGSR